MVGTGLVPQVTKVPGANASKGNTSDAAPTPRECVRQVALHKWHLSFAA